jgi:acetyl esterase/lipase
LAAAKGSVFAVSGKQNQRMNRHLWLASLLFTVSCQQQSNGTEYKEAFTRLNVAYGTHARQRMDMYLPAGRNTDSTKVLVLIHGGAWREGDKSDFTPYVTMLQQRLPGYAIFNLNYRLAGNGTNLFPSQEDDIKAAVEFIYDKRNDYGISEKFVFLGASAGAHLALLQAYKYRDPVKPMAVVSFFGPTELSNLYHSSLGAALFLSQVTGATPASHPVLYKQSSPASFVTPQSPPTLLLQGGADPLVPPAQSELLRDLLDTAGVPNQYIFYPAERHGWAGKPLSDSFDKIARFLKTHVK